MTEPNKPLEQMTAQERLDLGISYFKEGKLDEAIEALSSIRREEADPETYAQAQLYLGVAYAESGEWKQANKMLSNIRRSDNPETYAEAQLGLGLIYRDQDKPEQAIKTWSNIRRSDNPETYTQAQLNLGLAYKAQGKLDDAITAWSNIRRSDNPETYTQAQLNLGLAYYAQEDLDQAIKTWSNIRRSDNPETYTQAQLNLGLAYAKSGERKQAIKIMANIRREEADPKTYTQAQLNLGVAYAKSGKPDQAITVLSKIRREEVNPKTYAQARLGLGVAYAESGERKQAIKIWSNIRREEAEPGTYAEAQFNLGLAYAESGKREQAIKTWSKVRHEDDPKVYALAQLGLGIIYRDQDKPEQAIVAWSNIRREEADPETYARAQFNIGKIYEDKGDLERAKEAYCNAQDFFYYNYERVKRILECPPKVIKKLRSIAENTDEILKSLQVIPGFESKVAHYTRPQIAFDLFGDEKNNKNPSNFRLSTIRGVNDPTEGLVLRDYWEQQGISETIHTNDTATFVSCFTFNHDSLNQFRLYGKENGREATGVSLVFKKGFFSDQPDTLGFIAGPSTDLSSKSEQNKSNETGKTEGNNKKQLIGKSTLYRCIYLDPETGYWTLAQRDKSTFYREDKDKETAEGNWIEYSKKISKIEESFKDHLFDNNDSILEKLKDIFKEYNTYGVKEKQKILEAVRFILLPLQYLVKHIAFQEEQECRIMYITHLHDEKIRHDWEKQWMYVEYEEPVLPHIDEVYLSPGAAKYQDFFRILLDQKEDDSLDKKENENESKVRISQNPFRNKE